MTNSEVLRLLKEHRSEVEIVRSIKSAIEAGTAAFDLSPNALIALHQAGAGNNVLNAMMGDGSVRPAGSTASTGAYTGTTRPGATSASAGALNPQPLPPNSRVLQLLSHAKLSKGSAIKLAGAQKSLDPAVMQALQQQSSQARAERAQFAPALANGSSASASPGALQAAPRPMLLARPNTAGQVGPARTMGASGGSDPATGSTPNPAGSTPGGTTGGTTPSGSSNQPGTPQAGGPAISKTSMIHAPAPISACRFNATTPVVETVSGRAKNFYFTPDPGSSSSLNPNNQYTIHGCNFGAAQGQGDVHLVGAFHNNPSPVRLGIDSWSDTLIVATFDPTFQNEYDLDNIVLVVTNASGASVQLTGNHFVATRASRMLTRVPNSLVKLPTTYLSTDTFVSPATPQAVQLAKMPATSLSATILFYTMTSIWTSNVGDGYPQQRISFSDALDFSKLHAGFVVDDNIQTFAVAGPDLGGGFNLVVGSGPSCKFYDTVVGANMQGSSMLVGVQPAECDDSGKFIFAYYGLGISVTGPAGDKLDPWQSGLN